MTEKNEQASAGAASELNAELDSLLEMAADYLSAQKESRFAPCNPDFLIKHLASAAKQFRDANISYQKAITNIACAADRLSEESCYDVQEDIVAAIKKLED